MIWHWTWPHQRTYACDCPGHSCSHTPPPQCFHRERCEVDNIAQMGLIAIGVACTVACNAYGNSTPWPKIVGGKGTEGIGIPALDEACGGEVVNVSLSCEARPPGVASIYSKPMSKYQKRTLVPPSPPPPPSKMSRFCNSPGRMGKER